MIKTNLIISFETFKINDIWTTLPRVIDILTLWGNWGILYISKIVRR